MIDLGCGTGILARRLTDAGYEVQGVDLSADMLRIARSHAPRAKFVRGSLFDAELRPCVAVTAIGEVFNYAFDDRSGLPRLGAVVRRIHKALVPGGVLLFDVAGPGRHGGRTSERFHDTPAWSMHLKTQEDESRSTLTREIVLFFRTGTSYRRSDEHHVLRLYQRDPVMKLLRDAGFRVKPRRGYGDVRDARLSVFLAEKP